MRCNINGFMRNISRQGTNELQKEFLDNLMELRDDATKHGEFFDLYIFSDDAEYRKRAADTKVGKITPPNTDYAAAQRVVEELSKIVEELSKIDGVTCISTLMRLIEKRLNSAKAPNYV